VALGDVIARLAVSLSMETAAFEKGASIAEKRFAQAEKRFQKIGENLQSVGTKLSISVTAPLVALGKTSFDAAVESAEAVAQVRAALESMGPVAGRTAEQLEEMAAALQHTSTYDDDEILRKVTANLLTFGKISGEVFDRAQQAAVNLSARLGQDLQSSAVMLGKALNDPVKGVTALQRVGVALTEQQKEQIKTMAEAGDVAGAQAIILEELEKQYGGAAQAARDAAPGSDTIDAWREFQETIGAIILEVLPTITDILTKVLNAFNELSPEMKKVVVVGGALAAALGPVLALFGSMITVGAPLLSFLVAVAPAVAALGKALLLVAANPFILGLAAVILGIYLAWKNWDKITAIVSSLYNAVKTWILEKLGAIWDWLMKKLQAVGEAFAWLYDVVVGNSYVPDMVDGIASHMARLEDVMVKPAQTAAQKTAKAFQDLRDLMASLFPEIVKASTFSTELGRLEAAGLSPEQLDEAVSRLWRKYSSGSPFGTGSPTEPDFSDAQLLTDGMDDVGKAIERLTERAKVGGVRIAKSFKDMADDTLNALSRLTSAIKGGGFLGILEAVIGFGLQLGSIGVFGKTIANRLNNVPAYANGTNFHPGGLALVGERGPELVSMPRGSRVTPNNALGGIPKFEIIPSPYFDVVVDGRVMRAAPAIADAGAQAGVSRMAFKQRRRL
jgi:hypothetical protein